MILNSIRTFLGLEQKYNAYCMVAGSAHPGLIFKVHPKCGSHSKDPYLVKIVYTCNDYIETELVNPAICTEPHRRRFTYSSKEWKTYHHDRFELIKQ
jgi:hypothetical protein